MEKISHGDIIVFESEGDILGKLIALLTNSTVSHSAMVYGDNLMIEMGDKGIQVNKFEEDQVAGRPVHFLQRKPSVDRVKLIDSAKYYLDAKVRYDFPSLVFLAGLLIYRDIKEDSNIKPLVDCILKLACIILDEMLNKIIYHDDKAAMTCSQLVYQCYLDSGRQNWIDLGDPMLKRIPLGHIRLADYISQDSENFSVIKTVNLSVSEQDKDKVLLDLFNLLNTASSDTSKFSKAELDETVDLAAGFLQRIQAILNKTDFIIPMYALFVTPADLLNAANLSEYKTVSIKRTILG